MKKHPAFRPPARVIPFPDRQHHPKPPLPLVKRLSAVLDELEICLLALGIVSELKIKNPKEEVER